MSIELIKELNDLKQAHSKLIDALAKAGRDKANTEKAYRVELAKEQLTLKADGMAATLINDLSRGKPDIAMLKVARDIAESDYEVCLQRIYKVKADRDSLEKQIDAERRCL